MLRPLTGEKKHLEESSISCPREGDPPGGRGRKALRVRAQGGGRTDRRQKDLGQEIGQGLLP